MRTYQLMPVMPVKEWKRPEPTAEGISIRVASWSRALPDLYRYLDYCLDKDIPYLLHPMAGKFSDGTVGEWIEVAAKEHQDKAEIPIPWDVDHQIWLAQWLSHLGGIIASHPARFEGWHMPGIRDGSELHIPSELKHYSGWEDKLIKAIKRRYTMMQRAVNGPVIIDWGSPSPKMAKSLLSWARLHDIGLQHNALKEHTSETWSVHQQVSAHTPHGFQTLGGEKRAGDSEAIFSRAEATGAEWLELYPSQIRDWAER